MTEVFRWIRGVLSSTPAPAEGGDPRHWPSGLLSRLFLLIALGFGVLAFLGGSVFGEHAGRLLLVPSVVTLAAVLLAQPIAAVCLLIPASLADKALELPSVPLDVGQLLGVIVVVGYTVQVLRTPAATWRRSVLDGPVLALLLINMAYSFGRLDAEGLPLFLSELSIPLTYFLVYQLVSSSLAHLKATLWTLVLVVAAVVLVDVTAMLSGVARVTLLGNELEFFTGALRERPRLLGISSNPNSFGQVAAIAAAVSLYWATAQAKWTRRFLLLSAAVVDGLGAVLTQSRGAIYGLAAGVVLVEFAWLLRTGRLKSRWTLLGAGAGLLAVAIGGGTGALGRLSLTDSIREPSRVDPSLNRAVIWRAGEEAFLAKPWGSGKGTSRRVLGRALGVGEQSAHNILVGTAIEEGVVGLAVLSWFVFSTLWVSLQAALAAREPTSASLSAGLLAGMVCLWINNLFHATLGWMVVWVIFATLSAVCRYSRASQGGNGG